MSFSLRFAAGAAALILMSASGCYGWAWVHHGTVISSSDSELQQIRQVVGGPNFARIKTRLLLIRCVAHDHPCTIVKMAKEPDKLYVKQTYPEAHKEFVLAFNGQQAWESDDTGHISILEGQGREAIRMLAFDLNYCWFTTSCDVTVVRLADETDSGRTYAVFRFNPKDGLPMEMGIDKESHYPLMKREFQLTWTVDRYSDFIRGPLGDLYPKITETTRADQLVYSGTILSVKENIEIPDRQFDPPVSGTRP